MKLNQLIEIVMGNIFTQTFAWFRGLGFKSRPFIFYQFAAINQKPVILRF